MELNELIKKIEQWAIDRELDKKATVEAQSIKTAEEMSELIIGISKDNLEVIKDSIGDVFVTLVIGNMIDEDFNMEEVLFVVPEWIGNFPKIKLINNLSLIMYNVTYLGQGYKKSTISVALRHLLMVCSAYDLDFKECVQSAYDEIKDRKGKTVDGCFVKEEDLN